MADATMPPDGLARRWRLAAARGRARSSRRRAVAAALVVAGVFATSSLGGLTADSREVAGPNAPSVPNILSVAYLPVARLSQDTRLDISVREPSGRPVTLWLDADVQSELVSISPAPRSIRASDKGKFLEFETQDNHDLQVTFLLRADRMGYRAMSIGAVVGNEISVTTRLRQFIVPF